MAFGITATAALGAAATLGGAYLGSQGGGSTSSSAPWKPLQPYVKDGYADAASALDSAQAAGYYTDPRVAAMNPYQTAGLNMTGNFATGQATDLANMQMGYGMNSLQYGSQYGANAQGMLDRYMSGDPTGYALGMANQYANNPFVDGLIGASTRDISRNLYENQLPSLISGAASTGNMNNTRSGSGSIAEGVLRRGAEDRMGDISSTIRSGLFNQGLNSGLNQYNTQFMNGLAGNNQLLNAANYGSNLLNSGVQNMYNAGDAATRAGQAYQTQGQNIINGDMALFNEQKYGPLDLVNKYMATLGQAPGGTTSTTSSGGGATGALGGAQAGLGLYNSLAKAFPSGTTTTSIAATPTGTYDWGNTMGYVR